MEKDRFATLPYILEPQPSPGQRESRFPIPRDRSMNHPRKEQDHV